MAAAIKAVFPGLDVEINTKAPRRNSFECTVITEKGKEFVLWSGIDKGPPRKLKFPQEADVTGLIDSIKKIIS